VLSSNITIYFDSQEPCAKNGFHHFITKYGFTATAISHEADIYTGYSPYVNRDSRIQIILHAINEDGVRFLNVQGETVPFFKIPARTEGSDPLIRVADNGESYACLSINSNRIIIGFDIFTEIGRILAGYYDEYFLKTNLVGQTLRAIPVIDVLEASLFSAINRVLPVPCLEPRPVWPDGHKFAVVVTHDVDRVSKTYQYLPSILRSLKKVDLNGLGYHLNNCLFKHGTRNPYWTFDHLTGVDKSLGVKSTYYFLNEKGRLNPLSFKSWILFAGRYNIENSLIRKTIRQLSNDFEIGLHGSYNSYQSRGLLLEEKQLLESIVGSSMVGIRQHHLNYDFNITPYLHHICGFKYDTSIGFKPDDGIGFRRGTSFPFPVMLPDSSISDLLEIPLIIMDTALGVAAEVEECFELLDQVEKYNGVLTILWHSPSLNKNEFPMLFDTYYRLIKTAQARGAWIACASDVYQRVIESARTMVAVK
jgi:hypothetical protein